MADQARDERWLGVNDAASAWASAAREVLTEVAGSYLGVITYFDLGDQIQARTGLRSRALFHNWIAGVIGNVVAQCRAEGLPPLGSLVVHRIDEKPAPDESTVLDRLACYRRYADDVPAEVITLADDAARAKAAASAAAIRERVAKASRTTQSRRPIKREDLPPKICPTCFVALPASGVCDACW